MLIKQLIAQTKALSYSLFSLLVIILLVMTLWNSYTMHSLHTQLVKLQLLEAQLQQLTTDHSAALTQERTLIDTIDQRLRQQEQKPKQVLAQLSHLITLAQFTMSLPYQEAQAIPLLVQAQQIISTSNDLDFAQLATAIDHDLAKLRALHWPNLKHLYERIHTLQQYFSSPMLAIPTAASASILSTNAVNPSWPEQMLKHLKQLVNVYYIPPSMHYSILPLQPYALRKQHLLALSNLTLWSVLYQNQDLYSLSLSALTNWLHDCGDDAKPAQELITELAHVTLNPAKDLKLTAASTLGII